MLDISRTANALLYYTVKVSVAESGFIRQRRVRDQMTNLAQQLRLATRYYIKNTRYCTDCYTDCCTVLCSTTQQLVPEELSGELLREASVNLLQVMSDVINRSSCPYCTVSCS